MAASSSVKLRAAPLFSDEFATITVAPAATSGVCVVVGASVVDVVVDVDDVVELDVVVVVDGSVRAPRLLEQARGTATAHNTSAQRATTER